ncbi:MAG: DUF3987 domain-containing protein [Candidatus Tectomicrobia bacterium]|uniref:DUF3987 domain-containing protein n=1 Tax=Tectimicrobiota bacterium TaxID=2528274 RepID=A0A937W084_UNCTE|nr:DUF3987 domain-containing protein [Candidatus Tectomicrobia bacterium]
MNTPQHTISDDNEHVLTWPGEDAVLRVSGVTQDRARRLWAEVHAAKADGTALNHEQFNLLDGHRRAQFAAIAAAHNGQPPGDWDQRLLQAITLVQGQVAQGAGRAAQAPEALKSFPLVVFPAVLQQFIRTCALALPCPQDFLAVPVLSQLGAAIGTSAVVEIKPGWQESARLWTAVVADPGSKKSPALDLVMKPLYQVQHNLQQAYATAKQAYETDYAVYEKALAAWKRDKNAAADDRPAEPEAPVYPQVFSTDATVEALVSVLEQNPRGIVFVRDELAAWARAMNQYKGGKGADRQHWLSFWNGATTLVSRKSRPEPIVLRAPFVAVAGCMPPEVLEDLVDESGREDGFVHRILFTYPEVQALTWTDVSFPGTSKTTTAPSSPRSMACRGASMPQASPCHRSCGWTPRHSRCLSSGPQATTASSMPRTCRHAYAVPGRNWKAIAHGWPWCCFSPGRRVSRPRPRTLTRPVSWGLPPLSTISRAMRGACIASCMPAPKSSKPPQRSDGYDATAARLRCGTCALTKSVAWQPCVTRKTLPAYSSRRGTGRL